MYISLFQQTDHFIIKHQAPLVVINHDATSASHITVGNTSRRLNIIWNVKGSYTCISSNVIYAITCTGCEKLYIGERKRRLADRFTEHLRSIKNNSPDLPVAAHFNSPEHSILNAIVSAITICDDTYEKNEECLIYICGTLEPKGMNAGFHSFLLPVEML